MKSLNLEEHADKATNKNSESHLPSKT